MLTYTSLKYYHNNSVNAREKIKEFLREKTLDIFRKLWFDICIKLADIQSVPAQAQVFRPG